MKKLWEFNTKFQSPKYGSLSRKEKKMNPELWGGRNIRTMLQLLYVISMLCLLRYDEALRIMWSDIKLEKRNSKHIIVLSLPFRKTHQYGGMCLRYLFRILLIFNMTQRLPRSIYTHGRTNHGCAQYWHLLNGIEQQGFLDSNGMDISSGRRLD